VKHTFIKYSLVGGSALIVDGLVFYLLHFGIIGLNVHLSRIFAFFVAACAAWYFHKIFTFKVYSEKSDMRQLGKFLLLNGSGILLNYIIFSIGIYFFSSKEGVLLSFLTGSGIAFLYNYAISKNIIFKK
tara:strand:+ start:90 stop:476 length:387 start_codon:yes stop_codon:yes gene_type:complete